jgi:hypothetical protein
MGLKTDTGGFETRPYRNNHWIPAPVSRHGASFAGMGERE